MRWQKGTDLLSRNPNFDSGAVTDTRSAIKLAESARLRSKPMKRQNCLARKITSTVLSQESRSKDTQCMYTAAKFSSTSIYIAIPLCRICVRIYIYTRVYIYIYKSLISIDMDTIDCQEIIWTYKETGRERRDKLYTSYACL